MAKTSEVWTEENIAKMVRLWDGGMAASRIAEIIGAPSRNSILGKIHRMKQAGHVFARIDIEHDPDKRVRIARHANAHAVAKVRASKPHKPRKQKADPRQNVLAVNMARKQECDAENPYTPPPPIVIDASFAKPWTERRFGECAYPIAGQGADTVSCCAPTRGKTYCAGHRAIMFRPLPPSQKKRDQRLFSRLARLAA